MPQSETKTYYHASPNVLSIEKLELNRLFFVSDNKDFVISEFLFGKNYKFLYEVKIKKTKIKCFDILKVKCFRLWQKYLIKHFGDFHHKVISVYNGKLCFFVEDEVLPIMIENGFNTCIFDEIGGDYIGGEINEWGQYLKEEYKTNEISSIAIIDKTVIKKLKPIAIKTEGNSLEYIN